MFSRDQLKRAASLTEEDFVQLGRCRRPQSAIKANPSKPSVDAMLTLLDKLRVIEGTGVLLVDLSWLNANYQRAPVPPGPSQGMQLYLDALATVDPLLENPVLELSNNLAENAIRPVALGRRNWIHIGTKEAGPRVAAIISVVETCRRLKTPVRDYLGSVLPGLGYFPVGRIAELTPAAWAIRN